MSITLTETPTTVEWWTADPKLEAATTIDQRAFGIDQGPFPNIRDRRSCT